MLSILAMIGLVSAIAAPAGAATPVNGRVAFAREPDTEGALFTMNPDGSGLVQIGNGENIRFSPDGTRVSFACWNGPDHIGVCTVNPDGSGLTHVVPQTGGLTDPPLDFYPTAWSPDGGLLLIDAGAGLSENGAGIYTMRPDGTGLTRVTSTATEQIPYGFSPDGSKILFLQSNADGSNDLFVVRADGTGLSRLNPSNLTLDCCLPPRASWSPDGQSIVFVAFSSGGGGGSGSSLFTVQPDGSNLRRLTPLGKVARDAKWSPDGRWITFVTSGGFGWPEIAIVRPDGTGKRMITSPSDGLAIDPVWAPNSTQLLMTYAQFGAQHQATQFDVWTVHLDGSGLVQLTNTPEFDESQDWGVSPTG